jgi:hypothetical protein
MVSIYENAILIFCEECIIIRVILFYHEVLCHVFRVLYPYGCYEEHGIPLCLRTVQRYIITLAGECFRILLFLLFVARICVWISTDWNIIT